MPLFDDQHDIERHGSRRRLDRGDKITIGLAIWALITAAGILAWVAWQAFGAS